MKRVVAVVKSRVLLSSVAFIATLIMIGLLAGCGSGKATNLTPTPISPSATPTPVAPSRAQTPIKASISWGSRTRALSGPSSALSAVLILRNAAPNGADFTFSPAINRNAAQLDTYTDNLTSSNTALMGTWPLHVEFHAQSDGAGDVVGTVDATVTIGADGTGIGDLATTGTIGSVLVDPNQKVLVGATKALTFSVKDTSTPAKTLAITPGSASFAVTSGSDKIDLSPDGTITGNDAGTASVSVSVDNKTSAAENVTATYPGGGIIRAVSVAANDGSDATVTPIEGSLPPDGALAAPDLSATAGTVVRGGSIILSVVTDSPVDAILISIDGQSDYYRLDVSGSATRSAKAARKSTRAQTIPCSSGGCNPAQLLAQKYPVRSVSAIRRSSRSAGRASGTEYQIVLSVPSDISVENFRVNVQTVSGTNNSVHAASAVTVNQTAQSSGQLQISMHFSAPVDADLHVMTPAGEEIGYNHTSDNSGGSLDLDANAGCGVTSQHDENVTWRNTEPPAGVYIIRPNLWSACEATTSIDYVITVNNRGFQRHYTGRFSPSEANRNASTDPNKLIYIAFVASPSTDEGLLQRLLLAEVRNPSSSAFNLDESQKGMQAIRAIVENRKQKPRIFGAADATTKGIITANSPEQFAGFGGGVSAAIDTRVLNVLTPPAKTDTYVDFWRTMFTVASGPVNDPFSDVTSIAGQNVEPGTWGVRTAGSAAPGGSFVKLPNGTVAGQDFYTIKTGLL